MHYQAKKLTGACTFCSKLMDAAAPVAPTLTSVLIYGMKKNYHVNDHLNAENRNVIM